MKWSLKQLSLRQLNWILNILIAVAVISASFCMGYVEKYYKTLPWYFDVAEWGILFLFAFFFVKLCGTINNKECENILRQQALEKQTAENNTPENVAGEK